MAKMKDDQVRIEYMALGDLPPANRNPKEHDLDTIVASMRRFGYTQPELIDEATGKLVAGHGRKLALERLRDAGESPPARVQVKGKDWLVPVLRGISFENEQEAEAYVVADNRLVQLGGWDEKLLATMLMDISKTAGSLEGVGYNQADIDALLAFSSTGGEEAGGCGSGGLPDLPDYQAPPQTPRLIVICKSQEELARLHAHLGLEGVAEGKVTFQFEDIRLPEGDVVQ